MAVAIHNLTDTWTEVGTTYSAIKMNVTDTASASGSLLMDLQVGGSSKDKTDKSGNKTLAGAIIVAEGSNTAAAFRSGSATSGLYFGSGGFDMGYCRAGSPVLLFNAIGIKAANTGGYAFSSTASSSGAADAGIFRTSAGVVKATDGTASGNGAFKTGEFVVSALPAAGTAGGGTIAYVTDATSTTSGTTVAGGGANKVMVYSDGTNWIIL